MTERMIHTGGEQIQGNETGNFRDRGPRIGEKRVGGWASWTAQALFAWTRTHDEPRKSWTCGYIAAGLLRADVSSGHRAPARFWTVGAKALLLDACFFVYSRVARKRKFSTLSHRSAVENGSMSQRLQALSPQQTHRWKGLLIAQKVQRKTSNA